jgi:hypothetical protein
MSDENPIPAILARMQALGHIRLARGVVGKTSIVAGLVVVVLGTIAWRLPAESLFLFAGLLILFFFVFLAAVIYFAHTHPEQALLEGAEIIQYRQQEMAAKEIPAPPPSPLTLNPATRDRQKPMDPDE